MIVNPNIEPGTKVEFEGFYNHNGKALCVSIDKSGYTFLARAFPANPPAIRELHFPLGTLEFVERKRRIRNNPGDTTMTPEEVKTLLRNNAGYSRTDHTLEDRDFLYYDIKLQEARL